MADFTRLHEAYIYNQNQDWDRTRYQSHVVLNTAFGNKKTVRPRDLFKLPHDNIGESKVQLPTKDDIEALKKIRPSRM